MNMLSAMLGGGPLPIPHVPCPPCLADAAAYRGDDPPTPRQVATLVRGTAVCAEHALELVEQDERQLSALEVIAGRLENLEQLRGIADELADLARRARLAA